MRKVISLLVVVTVSVLVFGCGTKGSDDKAGSTTGSPAVSNAPSKLIGDWTTPMAGVGSATVSFAADGSMSTTGDFTPGGKDAKLIITGTWKEDGDTLHMVYQDVKFTGLSPEAKPREKAMEDGAKKSVGIGKDNSMVVKLDGDDSFSSTDSNGAVSKFTRKAK